MEGSVDEPKKKRRLLIIDVDENNVPVSSVSSDTVKQVAVPVAPPVPRTPVVLGPGHVQGRTQQEVLRLCREARFDEEKIEARIWHRVDDILKAKTYDEAQEYAKKAMDAASIYFLLNRKNPEKQAKAAERIAKMYRNKGEDEKADKQLAKAKKLRDDLAAEVKKP
jgi:hypothetical protein